MQKMRKCRSIVSFYLFLFELFSNFFFNLKIESILKSAGPNTTLVFSWSYWVLYGAAGGSLFTSLLFCCNPARN